MTQADSPPARAANNPWEREPVHLPGDFLTYVDELYELATKYDAKGDASRLVLDFLRHEEYDSYQWRALVGPIDDRFVAYVRAVRPQRVRWFHDPVFPSVVKVSHLAATCLGVYVHGRPEGTETNRGDVAGWGGDWMTFFGDWRRDGDDQSGYDFARANLMYDDRETTFKLTDLLDDADGHLLAIALRAGASLPEAVEALYGGPPRRRLSLFFEDRFRDPELATAIARSVLTEVDDLLINAGRAFLVAETAHGFVLTPNLVPDEELDRFNQGFTHRLLELIAEERERAAARTAFDT